MSFRIHSTVFATCLAATIAVGVAGAACDPPAGVASKTDRLSTGTGEAGVKYMTLETRKEGVSVLSRLALGDGI